LIAAELLFERVYGKAELRPMWTWNTNLPLPKVMDKQEWLDTRGQGYDSEAKRPLDGVHPGDILDLTVVDDTKKH
jgi:hypothetical protein